MLYEKLDQSFYFKLIAMYMRVIGNTILAKKGNFFLKKNWQKFPTKLTNRKKYAIMANGGTKDEIEIFSNN